jgi:glutathione synthase/RimK-type ligase-like ATP-grasp enzyme
VPRTIVTNRPETALAFATQIGGDLAIKSLGAISVMQDRVGHAVQYGTFTRRLCRQELTEFQDKIGFMPTLFQEFVPKDSELRITCVGDKVFACRIETRTGDLTSDDYRFDTANLRHSAVECPELCDRLGAYMRAFDINFGCFDFIVPKSGEPVFLECNCNGQWLWVEERTGQQIGKAIANALIRHAATF